MNSFSRIGIVALLGLTACGGDARGVLGLEREAPDEFSLEAPDATKQGPRASTSEQARAALLGGSAAGAGAVAPVTTDAAWGKLLDSGDTPSDSLKSEFELKPDGGVVRNTTSATIGSVESSGMGSAAESALLNQMGADKADADIRKKLGADVQREPEAKEEAESLYESMIGSEKNEPVLDPKGEAERLRKNKDAGKKPNAGKVVTEDTKKSPSVIDRWF
jgi:hypothetical protein